MLTELQEALPPGVCITDPDILRSYRTDWSQDPAAALPIAVVRITDAAQVPLVLRWASRHRVPVVPRGAGTGLAGGSSAVAGGIVLSLELLRTVEIDPDSRTVWAEPGALNVEVKRAAAEHGLWYPPDPSSYEICSIGGNVATNAGGLCCVKYGVTTDYVLGLDLVLADGTPVTLGGKRIKDVAGLSLLKLFVGSEGTLGIVTGVTLRLLPEQPTRSTLVATFPTADAAARAVVETSRIIRPSMMEFMDRVAINAVEDFKPMGLDRDAGALLVAQWDAPGDARSVEVAAMRSIFSVTGALHTFATDDPDEGEMFVQARRLAFPAVQARGDVLFEDVGVPIPLLPDLLASISRISNARGIEIPVVAHAGDGNTHPLIVFDHDSEPAARIAFDEVMRAAIALGGTITGEHGVGRAKRHALPEQIGPEVMDLTRRVKDALDPLQILNPGAVLESRL